MVFPNHCSKLSLLPGLYADLDPRQRKLRGIDLEEQATGQFAFLWKFVVATRLPGSCLTGTTGCLRFVFLAEMEEVREQTARSWLGF